MAVSFQQQARQRKFIYLLAIFALFTVSLLHRNNYILALAQSYQLTEETRGEVELTSSALRLSLFGSRGLVVAYLWHSAIDIQDKHQWNELELLVGSITKLQPFFVTPWLFQSWNLAFNVSVECDRTRDKYYYVSRGLGLLAEGERRNRGLGSADLAEDTRRLHFPGNPDLRMFMGQIYQMKFGTSDDKEFMRCLLEMSCIDPVHRDPRKLVAPGPGGGETLDPREFHRLCLNYPRLIRRLRDSLGCDHPKKVLDFLRDNHDIPSRYETPEGVIDPKQSLVKRWDKQFPLLPDPRERDKDWPNPGLPLEETHEEKFLAEEWVDAFVLARTWFSYAQKPLPPPMSSPFERPPFDPSKHRRPKNVNEIVFRTMPVRAQAFVAQALQREGWFAGEGWLVSASFPKGSFPPDALDERKEFRAGKNDQRYDSGLTWGKTYEMYTDLGASTGIYFSRAVQTSLQQQAKAYFHKRSQAGLSAQDRPPPGEEKDPGFQAAARLKYRSDQANHVNFEEHFAEAEAERLPLTLAARHRFFEADRLYNIAAYPQALDLYEEAWPLMLQVYVQFPLYTRGAQENAYEEWQLRHLRAMQWVQPHILRPLAMGLAQQAVWPHPDFDLLLTPADKARIIPIKTARGLMDWVQVFTPFSNPDVKQQVLAWSQAGLAAHGLGWTPLLVHPAQPVLVGTRQTWAGIWAQPGSPEAAWRYLIDPGVIDEVRGRLRLSRHPPPPMEGMMMPPGMMMPGKQ